MDKYVRIAEVINPSALTEVEKTQLIGKLYEVHRRIFNGVTKEDFASYVVLSTAEWTRIRIYKNTTGAWVGYCAVHRFKKQVAGKKLVIFRAEAGVLREFRGRSKTLLFGLRQATGYRLRHPFQRIYYLGSFVHPAVFLMFSRYMQTIDPQPTAALRPETRRLMLSLADSFHLEPIADRHEFVRRVGWITIESPADRAWWNHHESLAVKFFMDTNPGYVKGQGLLTLIPITYRNMALSLLRYLGAKTMRRLFPS